MFNTTVVIDKLQDSVVQKYSKTKMTTTQNDESTSTESNSWIVRQTCTTETDGNFGYEDLRNETDSNKIDKGPPSDFYWKICTTCNKKLDKRSEFVRLKNTYQCCQCKTRLTFECKRCHTQFISLSGINSHVRSTVYKCFECDFRATTIAWVQKHVKSMHPMMISRMHCIEMSACYNVQNDQGDVRLYKCSKCEKNVKDLPMLTRHIQICTGKKCSNIDESQNTNEELPQNVKSRIIYHCEECNKEVMYNKTLEAGNRNGKKKCPDCKNIMTFKCPECQRQCITHKGLMSHLISHNSKNKEYKCSECDYKNHLLLNLRKHYAENHIKRNTSIMLECSECGQKCKQETFYEHQKRCGVQREYNCDRCSFKSYHRFDLSKHMLIFHSAEKEVDCTTCFLTFKNETRLKRHQIFCGKQPHLQCDHCSFKTKYKCNLGYHVFRHHSIANEKAECPYCKNILKHRLGLKIHLRSFCGVKDYLFCKFCSFKTKYASILRSHALELHTKNEDSDKDVQEYLKLLEVEQKLQK